MGDVGEGPGVHEGGLTLQCLHQIGMKRVLHEDRHGAAHTEVVEGDRGTVLGQSHDDPADSLTQVAERRRIVGAIGQSKDGHQLAGHRYVVATLSRSAVNGSAETDDDVAKGPVVDIDDPPPADPVGIDG